MRGGGEAGFNHSPHSCLEPLIELRDVFFEVWVV